MATDAVVERILGAANHFEVFDIPPVAVDAAVVTKLYRRLALKCHPDKCKHPDGPAAFRRLTAAHVRQCGGETMRALSLSLSCTCSRSHVPALRAHAPHSPTLARVVSDRTRPRA